MSSTTIDPRLGRFGRTAQIGGGVLFLCGLPLLLGLNGGSVPLALVGMGAAIVGVLAFFAGSIITAPTKEPRPPLSPEQQRAVNTDLLIVVGAVMALLFPVGGFIAGAVLLGRRAVWGALIMVASFVSATLWFNHYFGI